MKSILTVIIPSTLAALVVYPVDIISSLIVLFIVPTLYLSFKTVFAKNEPRVRVQREQFALQVKEQVIDLNEMLRKRVIEHRGDDFKRQA